MKVIALRQLTGDYGRVHAGQQFEAPDDVAAELLRRGLVHRADGPKILYEMRGGRIVTPADEELKEREPNGKHNA